LRAIGICVGLLIKPPIEFILDEIYRRVMALPSFLFEITFYSRSMLGDEAYFVEVVGPLEIVKTRQNRERPTLSGNKRAEEIAVGLGLGEVDAALCRIQVVDRRACAVEGIELLILDNEVSARPTGLIACQLDLDEERLWCRFVEFKIAASNLVFDLYAVALEECNSLSVDIVCNSPPCNIPKHVAPPKLRTLPIGV
jgi:hypothetical protein